MKYCICSWVSDSGIVVFVYNPVSPKIRPNRKISLGMICQDARYISPTPKISPSSSALGAWPTLHKMCLPGAPLIFSLSALALAPGTLTPSPYRR